MRVLSVVFALMLSCRAHAQFEDKIEGHYRGTGGNSLYMRTVILDREQNIVVANIQTGVVDCIGYFTGAGQLHKKAGLKLHPSAAYDGYAGQDESCVVTVHFDKTGKHASVSESHECNAYHGHKCAFDGHLSKQKKMGEMPNPLPVNWPKLKE